MVYFDFDELDQVQSLHPLWSLRAFALARFRRSDFHGDPSTPLAASIRQTIFENTGCHHTGRFTS